MKPVRYPCYVYLGIKVDNEWPILKSYAWKEPKSSS